MKVNDLIFKELLRRGYSLDGNTRVWNIADSKLWYLEEEQAKGYLKIEDSKSYKKGIAGKEIALLEKHMPAIAKKILHGSAVNIVDIGCGDGRKAVIPIQTLSEKTKVRYCPVDISSYMVTEAIKNIRKLETGEVVEFKWNISDFENLENISSLLRDGEFRQNFLLFLGGTATNFELHEVIHEVAEAVDSDIDYLLLGVGLQTGGDSVKKDTKTLSDKPLDNFLGLVLKQIGIERDDVEFGTRFKHGRIEWYYTIQQDKKIVLNNRSVTFYKGDQILVGHSYRYTREQFDEALKIYFSEVEFFVNEDGSRALVLCKK